MKRIVTSLAVLFTFACMISMSVAANTALASLSDGLVAYYPFNGNANDESGNGNHGTVYGATLTTDRFGKANSAYSFDGSNDYIKITANSALDIYPDLTICLWFKRKGYSKDETDGGSTLIDRVWKDNNYSYSGDVVALLLNKTGEVSLYYNYDRLESWPDSEYFNLSKTVSLNNLYFVCICKKGESITSWFDGEKTGDITLPEDNNPYVYSGNWYIGSQIDKNNIWAPFNGEIDDVRVYNRALSESEIQELYKEGTTPTAPTATTNTATNITSNSATLNGTVNANGGTTTAWFEYGMMSGTYSNTTSTQTASGWGDTTISTDVSSLSSGTTYYYRAVAQNSEGVAYGSETSFTTLAPPTVVTGDATNITMISATLNGTVNAKGTSTSAWFEYGTLSGVYNNTTSKRSVSGSSDTAVSVYISGLSSGITYYYRLVAENNAGTAYGSEKSFATTSVTSPTPSPTPGTRPTPAVSPTPTPSTGYTGFIKGYVTNANTGDAISGATVATDTGGYSATTTSSGSYLMQVAADTYTLTASASGYQSASQTVTVSALSTTTASFSLIPVATPTSTPTQGTGVLFGFVYDEDDNPMKDVTVAITGSGNSGSEETDDDGYYEFRDLSAGDYTITYEKEGYQTQTLEVTLEEGDKKEVETVTMILTESGKIYGYVVNIKGDPIESVRLKLKGIGTKAVKRTSTDADGFFEFADLEADTYVIFASKKGYKKTKSTVKLEDGDDREVEIEMKKTTKRGLLMTEEIQ